MPLFFSLAAPGSPRFGGLVWPHTANCISARSKARQCSFSTKYPLWLRARLRPYPTFAAAWPFRCPEVAAFHSRYYSAHNKPKFDFAVNHPGYLFLDSEQSDHTNNGEASEEEASGQQVERFNGTVLSESEYGGDVQDGQTRTYRKGSRPLSRRLRKARRASRPTMVLNALRSDARDHYAVGMTGKSDLSYLDPRRSRTTKFSKPSARSALCPAHPTDFPSPISVYSILTRYLDQCCHSKQTIIEFKYTNSELQLLESRGYSSASVVAWAASLMEPSTKVAAKLFQSRVEIIPSFMTSLFLRRKYIRASVLGVLMRHVEYQLRSEGMTLGTLEILVIRLVRHARVVWPESMPWITSLYIKHAIKVHNIGVENSSISPKALSHLTYFTNKLLSLLALPTSRKPLLSARHQEEAQLEVLHFMANCSPSIMVTRSGFRSVTRIQLAHAQTPQEKEWARLKGLSWPPWKESQTAMDDDKGYEFGASRASRVLHRMHDAGYAANSWEQMAEIYAGWDTDRSPTIQTRTSLPGLSSQYDDEKYVRSLTWAGRIRATRNSREAWACFLAWESSGDPAHEAIFRAMFEMLHYSATLPEAGVDVSFEDSSTPKHHPEEMQDSTGDIQSPFYQVYLSEPIPTYLQLYGRMLQANVKPSNRLVAFFLETCPDFTTTLNMVNSHERSDHPITALVNGQHSRSDIIRAVPDYLLKAFIQFLCRFGSLNRPPDAVTRFASEEKHLQLFRNDRHYLLEYAYALLHVYRPKYQPAWTALLYKLVKQKAPDLAQRYTSHDMVFRIVSTMEQIDLDIDDHIFHLMCTETLHVLQSPTGGSVSKSSRNGLYKKGSSRLRTLFHNLVEPTRVPETRLDSEHTPTTDPSHVPSPAVLHTFVRVLGCFHDYEGLYSLSTWMTKHHEKISALAASTDVGNKALFRTLVALRAAVQGDLLKRQEHLYHGSGSPEIAELVRAQIESIEDWGGWPDQYYVDLYLEGKLKSRPLVTSEPDTDWLKK